MKGPPKWGFWGILGAEAKIFGGYPPRNAMTIDLRRLVKKLWRCSKYLVCTRGKEITKKKHFKKLNVYAVRVTFHPPLLTP